MDFLVPRERPGAGDQVMYAVRAAIPEMGPWRAVGEVLLRVQRW
ncbi:hypothetical protein ABZ897_55505 [Nonomuraea sp. NPDC046802]